jgi:hypothetical protein
VQAALTARCNYLARSVDATEETLATLSSQCHKLVADLKTEQLGVTEDLKLRLTTAQAQLDSANTKVGTLQKRYV